MKYGLPDDRWTAATEEMVGILAARAKGGLTISYSELVGQVRAIHFEPTSPALGAILGEISEAENTAGRGMLTVIVVHKSGDMKPGPGFFELAQRLGRDTSDVLKCWVEELKKVHGYWRGKKV